MLALWEYFWDNIPSWNNGDVNNRESWGSKGRGKIPGSKVDPWLERQRLNREYQGADKDYWDVRERYLRRFLAPVLEQEHATEEAIRESSPIKAYEPQPDHVAEAYSHLHMLQQARDSVVYRARTAANEADLRKETLRAIKLTLDIRALRVQYYERAAIILLLDLF